MLIDFITNLLVSCGRDGSVYDVLLVVLDCYTKITRYFPCRKTITVEQLTDLFLEHIVDVYDTSEDIVTDRGSLFTSQFWSFLYWTMKVKHQLSTTFHPQTDDQTERQNQTVKHYLRCYGTWLQDNWIQNLTLLVSSFLSYTSCISSSYLIF